MENTANLLKSERLLSLDAFRGTIMLLMASSGFGFAEISRRFPESGFWSFLGHHTEHAQWVGCTLWDLIQPGFMFMVGVALPWSISNRRARGENVRSMFRHALVRSLVLILLAVFITSAWSKRTEWIFTNVLAQIGAGYPFLFLLAFTAIRTQWLTALAILFVYWLAFAMHPLPALDFNWSSVGVPESWPHLSGFAAHWNKSANIATAFDRWFLNLFPRETPWTHSVGGYQTLNFIPSLATMIFGLLAGEFLRRELPVDTKARRLAAVGLTAIIIGEILALSGICPIVKRIWTPSWAVFSAGWVAVLLAGFFAVIEWRGWKRWAFPLMVAGLNPIALYCLWQLMGRFVSENFKRHFGSGVFELLGAAYAPFLERVLILLVFWLILFWVYRRRIFLRV
jgi:heparan-alpha-glucosaminide N-acetyltransferase